MGFKTIIIDDLENRHEGKYLVTLFGVGSAEIDGEKWNIKDIFDHFEDAVNKRKKEVEEKKE